MQIRNGICLAVVAMACTAAPAYPQWLAGPYLGTNFGDVEKGKGGIGASIGYFEGRVGVELDVERHWHFFKDSDIGNTATHLAEDVDTRATSVMGNVLVRFGAGSGAWRPYAAGGLGAVVATFNRNGPNLSDSRQNDFAFNVGGGVMRRLNTRVGIRGDARYIRVLAGDGTSSTPAPRGDLAGFYRDYGFWRVAVGVTVGGQ